MMAYRSGYVIELFMPNLKFVLIETNQIFSNTSVGMFSYNIWKWEANDFYVNKTGYIAT